MGDSSVNTVVNHYDGIFKFVHTSQARAPFLESRKLLASGQWKEAERKFIEAKQKCDTVEDIKTVELVIHEMKRYQNNVISATTPIVDQVQWNEVRTRRLEKLEENHDVLPQGVFILTILTTTSSGTSRVQLVGRKTLSQLWIQDKIPELFCSQVTAAMLVGLLEDWRLTDSKVVLFHRPLTPSEKRSVYQSVITSTQAELAFPFPLLKTVTRKEFTSPEEGWDVDPNFDHTLSHGEEHIREFTIATLKRLGFTSHRLYDPACSTGVFLSTLKEAFPGCTTIGQDLSQMMCEVAKARVDEVHCGNAMTPKIPPGSAHVVFIRFLNSEVVTSSEAEMLLVSLLPTVAVGGVIITFGHTPVLLSSSHFKMIDGFELLSCVGVANDSSSIFQYYVIKRVKEDFKCNF